MIQPQHDKLRGQQDRIDQAQVVTQAWLRDQQNTVAATTIWTPRRTGVYRVSVFQECTAVGLGTLDTNIGWTDAAAVAGGAAAHCTPCAQLLMTTKERRPSNNIVGSSQTNCSVFRAVAGQPITYALAFSVSPNGGKANVSIVLEEIA